MTQTKSEWFKKRYEERKSAGLCVHCGKPTSGRVYCEDCRRWKLIDYYACKEAGLCTRCKEKPARAGKTMCFDCAIADSDRLREIRERKKAKRAATGLCMQCGEKLAKDGQLLCEECAAQKAAKIKKIYWEQKGMMTY